MHGAFVLTLFGIIITLLHVNICITYSYIMSSMELCMFYINTTGLALFVFHVSEYYLTINYSSYNSCLVNAYTVFMPILLSPVSII